MLLARFLTFSKKCTIWRFLSFSTLKHPKITRKANTLFWYLEEIDMTGTP